MTVLLVLFFIMSALAVDAIIQYRKNHGRISDAIMNKVDNVIDDVFVHDNGLLPTMADGGQKINGDVNGSTNGTQVSEEHTSKENTSRVG